MLLVKNEKLSLFFSFPIGNLALMTLFKLVWEVKAKIPHSENTQISSVSKSLWGNNLGNDGEHIDVKN